MARNDVRTRITAKDETRRGLTKAERGVRGFAKRTRSALQGAFGPLAALGGAAGVGLITKQLIEAGSAALETRSKFETTFGDATARVDAFGQSFATMAGLSRVAFEDTISTTAAMVRGMGLSQDAAADLSIQVTQLAGDIGSFNNLPTADVAQRIAKALLGERESLKTLGIAIRETEVQQKALEIATAEGRTEITQADKAMASYQLIVEKAGVAVGDLVRTQDSAANQARQLAAQLENIRVEVGTELIPVWVKLLGLIKETLEGWRAIINLPSFMQSQPFNDIDTAELALEQLEERLAAVREERRGFILNPLRQFALDREATEIKAQIEIINANIEALEQAQRSQTETEEEAIAQKPALITGIQEASIAYRELAESLDMVFREDRPALPTPPVTPTAGPDLGGMSPEEINARAMELMNFNLGLDGMIAKLQEAGLSMEQVNAVLAEYGRLTAEGAETSNLLGDALSLSGDVAQRAVGGFAALATGQIKSIKEVADTEGKSLMFQGFGKIAASIFPPNPAQAASGAGMVVAGKLLSTLAGGGGPGGGGGRGGAGGGAGLAVPEKELDATAQRGPVILRFPDGPRMYDFADPAQMDAFKKMMEEATGTDAIIEVV